MATRPRALNHDSKAGKKAAPLPPWEIDRRNREERRRRQPARQQPMLDIPLPLQGPAEKEEEPDRGVAIIEPCIVDLTIKPLIIQL